MTEKRYRIHNDEITTIDGRVVKDILKELNDTENARLHHRQKRAELERENELLWEIIDGVRAFIKLKNRDYER